MLRHFATKAPPQQHVWLLRRSYAAAATSRQKRALDKQQIQGGASAAASAAAPASAAPPASVPGPAPTAAASGGGATPPVGGGGGGAGAIFGIVAAVGAGGALAYYNGMFSKEEETKPKAAAVPEEQPVKKEKNSAPSADDNVDETKRIPVTDENGGAGPAEEEETLDEQEPVTGNDVVAKEETKESLNEAAPPAKEVVAKAEAPATTRDVPILQESKIMEELEKVKALLNKESDKALTEAHSELAKLSILNLDNLDDMTLTQLKVRIVQMAKEMEDRTKWEAVRLQEFLTMKEKEVEDKYVLMVKKLRMEAENMMDERLAEQKKLLTKQAEEALTEQQRNSDAFIESSLKIQEQTFNEEREAFEKKTEEAMNAKYEELYGKMLAKTKEEFAAKLDQKVKQIESLSKKLSDLESALKSSQDFKAGSVQAHRITAAALALAEKLDSGEPAGAAINTIMAVASDNAVVSSAVGALPPSVGAKGVLTLQEIQTSFEEGVYPQCRRAANVPAGQSGLEGQIMGMLFSKLKYPPGPDDPAPESEKDAEDYVLARARKHVQLGELEDAVKEMDKLTGQASFVAKDWEESVKARVAVEKALKVIRMECALANESLAQGSSASA